MELHQVIRKAREEAGLTLTEAAQRLGVGKATLSRLETKKGPITATRLTEIAQLYGVRPADLLDGTIKPLPDADAELREIAVVVETVERIIDQAGQRPTPEKVGSTVVEILKLARADRDLIGSDFDVGRYVGLAQAILR